MIAAKCLAAALLLLSSCHLAAPYERAPTWRESRPAGVCDEQWLVNISGTPSGDVVAVGGRGLMLRRQGGRWLEQLLPTDLELADFGASAALGEFVVAHDWNHLILPPPEAMGITRAIYHRNEDGWSESLPPTGGDYRLFNLWVGERYAYAAGDRGQLWRYEAGTWRTVASGLSTGISSIWGPDEQSLLLGGPGPAIYRFDGETLSPMVLPEVPGGVHGVYGCGDTVFAVGSDGFVGGFVLQLRDDRWTVVHEDPSLIFTAVWCSSARDVHISGGSIEPLEGVIKHFDGVSWSRALSTRCFVGSLWGRGERDVYAVSGQGIFHYGDD